MVAIGFIIFVTALITGKLFDLRGCLSEQVSAFLGLCFIIAAFLITLGITLWLWDVLP